MPKFAAGVKTGAGSVTLPLISLFAGANTQANVTQIAIANTTNTAFDVKLARISSGPGTVGAGLVETPLDNPGAVSLCQAFTTHTAGAVTLADAGYRWSIGAQIGAGVIWPFEGEGIEITAAAGTVNGLCLVVENGAGQAAQAYICWTE